MKSTKAFAEELIRLRTKKGLTQRGLAKEVGLSASTISSLEKGARQPSFKVADLLAGFFGVTLAALLDSRGEEEPSGTVIEEKQEGDRVVRVCGPDLDLTVKGHGPYVIEYSNGIMKGSVSI